jgi:hypothetical protein
VIYSEKWEALPDPIYEVLVNKWFAFLQSKYGSLESLNRQRSTRYFSFSEIQLPKTRDDIRSFPKKYPPWRRDEFIQFIRDLDDSYFGDLRHFIKSVVGRDVPLTSTQVDYTFPDVILKHSDFIDIHSYWCLPRIIPKNSVFYESDVEYDNSSMVPFHGGPYHSIVASRFKGKPMVISEINTPSANDYAAEAILVPAIISKLQDHDAVIYYAYQMETDYELWVHQNIMNSFSQKSLFPIASDLFRGKRLPSLENTYEYDIPVSESIKLGAARSYSLNPLWKRTPDAVQIAPSTIPAEIFNKYRIYVNLVNTPTPSQFHVDANAVDSPLDWVGTGLDAYRDSFLRLENDSYNVFIGFTNTIDRCQFRNIAVRNIESDHDHFIFSAFNKDGIIGAPGLHVLNFQGKRTYSGYRYLSGGSNVADIRNRHGVKILLQQTAAHKYEQMLGLHGEVMLTLKADTSKKDIAIWPTDKKGEMIQTNPIPFSMSKRQIRFTLSPSYQSILYLIQIMTNH